MKGYRLSALAQKDIDSIWEHLAANGGMASAERFVWRLYELLGLLGQNPAMGRLSRMIAKDLRKFPLDNYLVYYRVQEGRVFVARILHGRRRQRKAYLTE